MFLVICPQIIPSQSQNLRQDAQNKEKTLQSTQKPKTPSVSK